MNGPLDETRLIELAALPPGHPRRTEAEKDPLARAWLVEHDAFQAGGPLGPEEEERVRRAADAVLAKARAEASRPGGTVIEMPRAAHARRGLPRWALAAAALAVVAGAAVVVPRLGVREAPDHLRSISPAPAAVSFEGHPARFDAAGRLVLAWSAHPDAGAYRVEVLSGLDAVASHDAAAGDSLVLDPASLPAGGPLTWRVLALRDGEVIATTTPRALPR